MTTQPNRLNRRRRPAARERGAAALLAMMFLVIFGSLATAMAIVAHGNLRTADSHLKLNRALSAADSGMQYVIYNINEALAANDEFVITEGVIDEDLAEDLWIKLRDDLYSRFSGQPHNITEPDKVGAGDKALRVGPIAVGAYDTFDNEAISVPAFKVIICPHPLDESLPEFTGHSYDSKFYDRMPYGDPVDAADKLAKAKAGIDWEVSEAAPLTAQWIRVKVIGFDGPRNADGTPKAGAVVRSVSMDFRIDKKIRAAVLSKSRVMIGRNVMIEGRVGSKFTEVNLENGHPVQMESDFLHLLDNDTRLDFMADLENYDSDGDNRLSIGSEISDDDMIEAAKKLDVDKDGYVSDWDLFFDKFDSNADNAVTVEELKSGGLSEAYAQQLVQLIDTFHDDTAANAGVIDFGDRYAKVRGEVLIKASKEDWEAGAAKNKGNPSDSTYRDYFGGPIHPELDEAPLVFEAGDENFPEFTQDSFQETADNFAEEATSDVYAQASPTGTVTEAVPYGAAYPYDYYERPVFEGVTFTNVRIPRGCNALFRNCVFKGVTFVDTAPANMFPHPTVDGVNAFNYSGMQEADGSYKYPDLDKAIADELPEGVTSTKGLGNNIRFENCRFEGSIVTGDANTGEQPDEFSHTRNKLTFTGDTQFPDVMDPTEVPGLSAAERAMFRRGRIIAPHFSVEVGTFTNPNAEPINLTGTIVAGVLDMRGQVRVDGTILTTFEPISNEGPVLGETSPQFNTTLGYFSSADGDLEAELPPDGLGVIQVRYNPTLPLPDGVRARISVDPIVMTYYEGGLAEPAAAE